MHHKSLIIHPAAGVDMVGSFAELVVVVVRLFEVGSLVLDQLELLLDLGLAEGACGGEGVFGFVVGAANFVDLLLQSFLLIRDPVLGVLKILLQHFGAGLLDLLANAFSHLLKLLIQVAVFGDGLAF